MVDPEKPGADGDVPLFSVSSKNQETLHLHPVL